MNLHSVLRLIILPISSLRFYCALASCWRIARGNCCRRKLIEEIYVRRRVYGWNLESPVLDRCSIKIYRRSVVAHYSKTITFSFVYSCFCVEPSKLLIFRETWVNAFFYINSNDGLKSRSFENLKKRI